MNILSIEPKKTCVITGAGSGIGRAAAIAISKDDTYDNIVLIGRDSLSLKDTNNMMETKKEIINLSFDLNNLEEIPALIDMIYLKYGSIDCLMNIAGYTDPQPLLTTTIDNMLDTYRINVMAPFVLIRECVRYMKESNYVKKIINIASTAGVTPRPGWLSYASSKAAIVSISETLSVELAEYKIKVYCVSPGRCATRLRKKLAPNEDQSKIMQPEEVGFILMQLASRSEQCLDGQNIIVRKK